MTSQIPNSESTHGRMRRPSEKVQAMIDKQESAKHTLEHQAHEKANWRKTLAHKHEQASKAAEADPFMAATLKTPTCGQVASLSINPEKAFTTRSVGSVHATQATSRPAMLATLLTARQGKVPPASTTLKPALPARLPHAGQPAIGTLNKQTAYQGSQVTAKSATIVGTHGQTPIQATKSEGLKQKKAYFNVVDASPPKKRAHARLPSPYLSASQVVSAEFGDLSIGDENRTMQIQNDLNLKKDPSKLPGHSVATKDEVSKSNAGTAPSVKTAGGTDPVDKTHVKAADYDIGTRSVIQTAIRIYCATLLSNDPYAPPVKELEWAKAAWGLACDHHEVKIPHDAVVLRLLTTRTSHLHGQFKLKARPAIAAVYGFDTTADTNAVKHNQALFLKLKQDSAFIFRCCGNILDDHTRIYMTSTIQQVINAVLFKNKGDDGIQWAKYYNPFPVQGFVLTITAIECAINEWESGIREMIVFKEHEYSGVFRSHLASLDEFNTMTASIQLLPRLLQQVYNNGSAHAGVVNSGNQACEPKKAIPNRAFLNAINEYKSMVGATDQVTMEPEGNAENHTENHTEC